MVSFVVLPMGQAMFKIVPLSAFDALKNKYPDLYNMKLAKHHKLSEGGFKEIRMEPLLYSYSSH